MQKLLRRAAYLPVGILIYLIALEVFLQIGAWAVKSAGRDVDSAWLAESRRILCVGDSNTYGLYLEREEAYPQQLETLWNESGRSPTIEVLNFGFPGSNSSHHLRDLPRMLETVKPDLVIALTGANDFWTLAVPVDATAESRGGVREFLRRHSRVYRFFYMLPRGFDTSRVETSLEPRARNSRSGTARYGDDVFRLGWVEGKIGPAQAQKQVERNIRALVDRTERFGTKLVLLTYASNSWFYGPANAVIRRTAQATRTPLIDVGRAFEAVCETEKCPNLLFADGHPNAAGYRLVAETVAQQLGDR
jgi:lysophospholipase L1-like esterase